jgi:ABC-2 type transport system ATP-binding protein
MILAQDLTKSFGHKPILRGISMQAEPKQITLMVGPNGAGKSTTVKVLAGLIRPRSGAARIDGFDIVRERIRAQRATAYLPQRPSFHPKLTCLEILRFYAGLRGIPASRCEAMLQLTGLGDVAKMRTEKLSGGMRQFCCSMSQASASIPAGENGFSRNSASKPNAEKRFSSPHI